MKELDLGKEKISVLIKKFAIPCVISMIVAALYNIVDQIFIGWSPAGADGNAATNIVYPFTVVALAFALLIGDGAAALYSLSLGAKDEKKANKSIGNGLILLIVSSLVLALLGYVCKEKILILFGGNPKEKICFEYALDYYKVICLGIPFYIIGQGLNASIRSDGSPKYAMTATLIGAISNIILDPIFIFGLKQGVKGAAIATIIGQILTFIVSIYYLTKAKSFHISKDSVQIELPIVKKILSLGLASFITQIAIVIIISTANNLIAKYGYMTLASTGKAYGAVVPLAIIGICMKVFGIVISIVIGVALGGQPIIGYNMGAGKKDRVKETCSKILIINFIVGLVSFLLFEIFPDQIIRIFGKGNGIEYIEYARCCLRIFLGGIILTCLIKTTSILLQSMGSSFKSTLLALSRDVLFFVPSIIIIAFLSHSVVVMLWSAVVADVCAFILGFILLRTELNKLNQYKIEQEDEIETQELVSCLNQKVVITISREYGSGGHFVGQILAQKLGIPFYDKEIIDLTSKKYGYSKEYIKNKEEKKKSYSNNMYYAEDNHLFEAESEVIKELSKSSCVIVGRCADYVLRDHPDVIKILIYSDKKSKINRVHQYYNIPLNKCEKEINKINKMRSTYYEYYTSQKWNDIQNYDLAIHTDVLGVHETAHLLGEYIIHRTQQKKD